MSNSLIVISIIFFILFVIITLVFILFKMNKQNKVNSKVNKRNERNKVYIVSLDLPKGIEKISKDQISQASKSVFSVFKTLDFKEKPSKHLDANEWHSWQVSILLKLYKFKKDFFIPNKDEIFHKDFLSLGDTSLDYLMNDIMLKYKKIVQINKIKDDLCKDVVWTSREISIIFLFLSKYKEF